MSLQIWLPLNGNINNQGVLDVSTSGAPASWSNGKIGKCATFTGNIANRITTPNMQALRHTNNFSYCVWLNHNYSSTAGSSQYAFTYGRADVGSYGYGIWIKSTSVIACWFGARVTELTCPANEWHHITVTVSGSTINYYIDGTLNKTATTATPPTYLESECKGLGLGCFHYSGDIYPYYGSMNDFRIYDHCLSPKEVKEISKGLFLHYKLGGNDGYFCGRNLVPNSYRLNGQWSAAGNYIGTTTVVADADAACGYHIESKCTTAGSGPHYPVFSKSSDKIGETYTWSFEAKCSVNKSAGTIGHECGGTRSIALTTTWTRYTHTWKFTDEKYHSFVFYPGFSVGEILYIRDFKIEENSKPSLWTPAPEDNPSLYNTTTEFDTSGFGNNGTIVGSIGTDGTSPRYDCSYLFNTNATYINTTLTTAGYSNSYTISYWAKKSNMTGCMAFGFADGNRLNVWTNNGVICWNTGDSENNPFQNNGTSVALSTYNNGNWHHYAVTGNGTTTTLYIDGEKVGTAKTYKAITGTQLYISGWNSGTDYAWVTGSISDFRMYATALSASDVKELYNAPISITNTGVLMTQGEFKEV